MLSDLSKTEIKVPSWIRGRRESKDSWEIDTGEILELQHEPKNLQDKNAIAVIIYEQVVGHIARALASTKQGIGIVRHFLTKSGNTADVKVVGKAVNRGGGYGMEVPCIYRFTAQQSHIKLLANLLDLENNLSVRDVSQRRGKLKPIHRAS